MKIDLKLAHIPYNAMKSFAASHVLDNTGWANCFPADRSKALVKPTTLQTFTVPVTPEPQGTSPEAVTGKLCSVVYKTQNRVNLC